MNTGYSTGTVQRQLIDWFKCWNKQQQPFIFFGINKVPEGRISCGLWTTGSKVRTNNANHCTLQDKQNEWSFYGFSSNNSNVRTKTPIISSLHKTNKVNGNFMGFHQLGQKLN